jgi:lipid-A-disaccharide synthase
MSRILISCGEPSGDLYAAALATEIRRLDPSAQLAGLGGEHLARAGAALIGNYRGLAVTGLVEALSVVPRSLAMYRRLVAAARTTRPDVFVAIDFPELNFRLAAAMRRLDIPIVYYVPPQLWAWRRGRIRALAALADRVLLIFPFERPMYREAGIDAEFVGHPLLDLARARSSRQSFLAAARLDADRPVVALLPGSRPNELRAILPTVVKAAQRIAARLPAVQFVVARAPGLDDGLFEPLDSLGTVALRVVEAQTDDVLAASDVAITCSGTATVQAAIHGCPMVVVYRLSPLTYRLGKRFLHVDTYAMANLVAGARVVPELIQDDFTPESVARSTLAFLTDAGLAAQTRGALAAVTRALGEPGASVRAAEAVLRVAAANPPQKLV